MTDRAFEICKQLSNGFCKEQLDIGNLHLV